MGHGAFWSYSKEKQRLRARRRIPLAPLGKFVGDGQIQILVDAVKEQADRNGKEGRARDDRSDPADTKERVFSLRDVGLITKVGEEPGSECAAQRQSRP